MSAEHLGRRLRAVRLARNYTIANVATVTGLSKSFISMLENGKTNISVDKLHRLAKAYELSINDLLPDESSRGLIQIVRRGEGAKLKGFGNGVSATMLVRDMHRRVQPVLLTMKPGTEHRNEHGHAGEEFLMIVEGEVEISIDQAPFVTLTEGDTAFYPSALSHVYRNPGWDTARILTISVPNTWFHS